ncbi:MAG: sugar ABC transporter permease [Alphaproteobacteria bacterium]|nr:sugar ABC transporter permease [Alphaproteobacteria bacterium]
MPGTGRAIASPRAGFGAHPAGPAATAARRGPGLPRRTRYWFFILPTLLAILAIILFPWVFTVWMSLHEWAPGSPPAYVGGRNFMELFTSRRFYQSIGTTIYFTLLSVVLPLAFGVFAAVVFHRRFPLRGLLRGIFILPMMATPVALALVWTMMFHPQLGVLNYLLSLVGIPPQLWVFAPATVVPSLAMVETWHWTPLVALIVLGGLAALPVEPYEAALTDGATRWQTFRYITLPLVLPFIVVAAIIRTIDAMKTFETIFVITQGGPGVSSETVSIHLYLQAFSFHNIGYASALVIVFFALIVALSLFLLFLRQKVKWS